MYLPLRRLLRALLGPCQLDLPSRAVPLTRSRESSGSLHLGQLDLQLLPLILRPPSFREHPVESLPRLRHLQSRHVCPCPLRLP